MNNRVMTTKRREAIHRWVELMVLEEGATIRNAVAYTLAAERIRSDDLYAKLARHGYLWRSRAKRWTLRK